MGNDIETWYVCINDHEDYCNIFTANSIGADIKGYFTTRDYVSGIGYYSSSSTLLF